MHQTEQQTTRVQQFRTGFDIFSQSDPRQLLVSLYNDAGTPSDECSLWVK